MIRFLSGGGTERFDDDLILLRLQLRTTDRAHKSNSFFNLVAIQNAHRENDDRFRVARMAPRAQFERLGFTNGPRLLIGHVRLAMTEDAR